MAFLGSFIDGATALEDIDVAARVAVVWRDEADGAVEVLVVVQQPTRVIIRPT
jgi:hypothetical protein